MMKKALFAAIVWFALSSDTMYAQTDAASSIDTWTPDNFIAPFIKHGELKCQGGKLLSGEVALYFYRPQKDQSWMLIDGNLGALNVFLKEEIDSSSSASQFLDHDLYLWLIATMGGDEWIINKGLLHGYAKDPLGSVLEKYLSTGTPTQIGKNWKLQFYTLTINGGVQLWSTEGVVFPLQISSYKRTLVLPDGTFQLPRPIR